MFDYITIIEKNSINVLPNSILGIVFAIIFAIILIPTIIHIIILKIRKNNFYEKVIFTELIAGAVAMVLFLVFEFAFCKYFLVPSGRYKYKVTIDKNNITVSQYEEFIEKYKPEIKDGYYYFEYKDLEVID